jgi:hypothetical protein
MPSDFFFLKEGFQKMPILLLSFGTLIDFKNDAPICQGSSYFTPPGIILIHPPGGRVG